MWSVQFLEVYMREKQRELLREAKRLRLLRPETQRPRDAGDRPRPCGEDRSSAEPCCPVSPAA